MNIKCPKCHGLGITAVITCRLCNGNGNIVAGSNKYCHSCGQPYRSDATWPKKCSVCEHVSYRNPIPATVVLLPVDDGLLLIRRKPDPGAGKLAFPGGCVDFNQHPESWQQAGVREVREEANIQITSEELKLIKVETNQLGYMVLFCFSHVVRKSSDLPEFYENIEASERIVVNKPIELAFSLQTELMKSWFSGEFRE